MKAKKNVFVNNLVLELRSLQLSTLELREAIKKASFFWTLSEKKTLFYGFPE